jgi:hypothetical protein
MARFADALNREMETIKRPPPLPIGHYIFTVPKMPGAPESLNSQKGDYEKLTIDVQVVQASDDVDPDELTEFGNVAGTPMRIDFIFNNDPNEEQKFEGTLNRLKRFMEHCGVTYSEGDTLGQKLAELVGAQFLGEVKHRPDPNDPEVIYNEVGRTAPA